MTCKRQNDYGVKVGRNYPTLTSGHLWGCRVVLVWLKGRKIVLPRFIFQENRPRIRCQSLWDLAKLARTKRIQEMLSC